MTERLVINGSGIVEDRDRHALHPGSPGERFDAGRERPGRDRRSIEPYD